MRIQRFVVLMACGITLGACTHVPTPEEAERSSETFAWGDGTTPLWREAELLAQPRLQTLHEAMPEDLGHAPEATDWQPVASDHPAQVLVERATTADTPAALLAGVADALPASRLLGEDIWEQTRRVLRDDAGGAEGVILHWGMKDDAVAGRDYRVTMEHGDAGWQVTGVSMRLQCRRGISDEGVCQ